MRYVRSPQSTLENARGEWSNKNYNQCFHCQRRTSKQRHAILNMRYRILQNSFYKYLYNKWIASSSKSSIYPLIEEEISVLYNVSNVLQNLRKTFKLGNENPYILLLSMWIHDFVNLESKSKLFPRGISHDKFDTNPTSIVYSNIEMKMYPFKDREEKYCIIDRKSMMKSSCSSLCPSENVFHSSQNVMKH